MQTEALKRYLSERIAQIQDESVLFALKTIIDREIASYPPQVQAEQDQTPDTPAPGGKHENGLEEQDEKTLLKGVDEEAKDKAIEDWLKNL